MRSEIKSLWSFRVRGFGRFITFANISEKAELTCLSSESLYPAFLREKERERERKREKKKKRE